jgi:hypothetical protein
MRKSRRERWVGLVARMRIKRNAYRLLLGRSEGKRPLGRPRCRWMGSTKKRNRRGWHGWNWSCSEWKPVVGLCEYVNELSGSIKCWEVLEWLHNWWLLEKGSASWR